VNVASPRLHSHDSPSPESDDAILSIRSPIGDSSQHDSSAEELDDEDDEGDDEKQVNQRSPNTANEAE
jgi:hypothetical protein